MGVYWSQLRFGLSDEDYQIILDIFLNCSILNAVYMDILISVHIVNSSCTLLLAGNFMLPYIVFGQ